MFQLDVRSRKPIYEQLVDKIKELIINRILKPDEQLPSVRMLSSQLTINPNTIQRAYRELESQGYIYSIKGKGNFVSAIEHMPSNEQLNDLKKDIRKLIAEAIYLGLTKEDLYVLFDEAHHQTKGVKKHNDSGKLHK
ncbi:GntR family transcriptional regulator [Metabacillus litoralis]|uniref:GntR family transcriptional regulator n=1 Tax=Metabacillus litoralis TaxID=152268 RepID=UPI00203C1630|nr:GntR family transcriptional regulator [Metabacillus litoralis]MCM3412257.1 GntR family transcriptional regulator [Metabacillus litoralis]